MTIVLYLNYIKQYNLYGEALCNYRLPRESPEKLFVARLQVSTALISRAVVCLDTTGSVFVIFNNLKDEGNKQRRIILFHFSALCLQNEITSYRIQKRNLFLCSFKVPFESHTTFLIKTVNVVTCSSLRWHGC